MDVSSALSAAGDLLLGARCPGCGRPWWGACPECRSLLTAREPTPTWPDPTPDGFPLTVTSGPYHEVLRGLIVAHKEDQALMLTPLLAGLLASSMRWLLERSGARDITVTVVPVPSARAVVRRRGFDATGVLARHAVRRLHPSFPRLGVRRLLRQRSWVQDQAGLGAADRAANLTGGLRSVGRAHGWVLLVDDLVTTGATLTDAARALRARNARILGAATVAATQRRRPTPSRD